MKLTVSMASYDDYDGTYFTIQALRLYHPNHQFEIIVLDNNPQSPHGAELRRLVRDVPNMRLIPVEDRRTSFVKYDTFNHATGDIIIGLDCHVLLNPGFFDHVVEFYEKNPDSMDLLTGPLLYDGLRSVSTHMEPKWRGQDFGCWATDKAGMETGAPFEVPMQGMGCFCFRRSAWKGIHARFDSFGAEEWYVAEKVRSWGGRVMCHPEMKWVHRFGWPKRTFPMSLDTKMFNYYLGWLEVYKTREHPAIQEMTQHWLTLVGETTLEKVIRRAEAAL